MVEGSGGSHAKGEWDVCVARVKRMQKEGACIKGLAANMY